MTLLYWLPSLIRSVRTACYVAWRELREQNKDCAT